MAKKHDEDEEEDGYLIFSDEESYEVLSILSDAHRDLPGRTGEEAGKWIDELVAQAGGIGAVALGTESAQNLLNLLDDIERESGRGTKLNLHTRAMVRQIEEVTMTAGERVRRPATQGPRR
jgi:hypothetical protein